MAGKIVCYKSILKFMDIIIIIESLAVVKVFKCKKCRTKTRINVDKMRINADKRG
jgi:hypothetical protein